MPLEVVAFTEEGHPYPYGVRNMRLSRDQVIEFYQWLLDEDAFMDRVHLLNFNGDADHDEYARRLQAAIENWKNSPDRAVVRLDLRFKNADDAVLVRMKYT